MGIRDKPITPGSPWQNGFCRKADRIDPTRGVDHVVVLGEAHLRRILRKYAAYYAYYNELRTHRSLDKAAPIHRAIQRVGRIVSAPVLVDFITIIAESDFRADNAVHFNMKELYAIRRDQIFSTRVDICGNATFLPYQEDVYEYSTRLNSSRLRSR